MFSCRLWLGTCCMLLIALCLGPEAVTSSLLHSRTRKIQKAHTLHRRRLRNLENMTAHDITVEAESGTHGMNNFVVPTFAECNASYGRRDYKWITEIGTVPPMLLTFPGSGTTMSQLLIEYATGVYSGSIYPEDELYGIMPGTAFCGQRLSLIKAHIKDIAFKTLPSGDGEGVTFKTNSYVAKCRNGIIHFFDRFIIVLRNPWASIWSNFQRDYNTLLRYTEEEQYELPEENRRGHTGGIPVDAMNYTAWEEKALRSPHYSFSMFNSMWNTTFPKLFSKYTYDRKDDINFGNSTYYHAAMQKAFQSDEPVAEKNRDSQTQGGNSNILVVRYEDLMHAGKRVHVLRKMVDFTRIGLKRDSAWKVEDGVDEASIQKEKQRLQTSSESEEEYRRLHCAFILSDRREIRRSKDSEAVEMKAKDAYKDNDLVCSAWEAMQGSADELMRYGYYHGPHGKEPPTCG